jgi:Ca2+-transporting ATPase
MSTRSPVTGTKPRPDPTGHYHGLSTAEARSRLLNRPRPPRPPLGRWLRRHLRESPTDYAVLLLVAVAAVYAVLAEFKDAAVIMAVVLGVVWIQLWMRWRASRALASLSRLAAPRTLVWRDGRLQEIPAGDLVRGDEILLLAGSRVPADARLLESQDLLVDESLVTGESQPVEFPDRDRSAELKAGTQVLRGRAVAVVTAVGSASTLGRVAALVRETEAQPTPLQLRMSALARRLLAVALGAGAMVLALGLVLGGQSLRTLTLVALALAFAGIPSELPVLVVIALGLGAMRLARLGAIVRRLAAAETLGTTTLVCTDKTGTLTENRISLSRVVTAAQTLEGVDAGEAELARVVRLARLASESEAQNRRLADPIDLAVCRASGSAPGPAVSFAFDSSRRLASGLAEVEGELLLGVKGAPEALMVRATRWRSADGVRELDAQLKDEVVAAAAELTAGGARVLAVGSRVLDEPPTGGPARLERDLCFEGLLAFNDPLRPEVPGAVRTLLEAGVSITMVTGDQPATAAAVARAAGLGGPTFIAAQIRGWDDRELAARTMQGCVVARARPDDKLRIVRAAAAAGQVVAATGDGINDAPALEAAAIGVAMGRGGSDVARESADLILRDDNLATLARATAEGRRIYENLRKGVRYYLAVKLALVAVSLALVLTGRPLPFLPADIAVIELFIDLGTALAFVGLPPEADSMRRRPRDPAARFLDSSMLWGMGAGGVTLAALAGGAYAIGLAALGVSGARTLALVAWLAGHAMLGLVMGWERVPLRAREVLANPAMVAWAGAALGLAVALLASTSLATLLHAAPVPVPAAVATMVAGLAGPLWLEGAKRLRVRREAARRR